MSQHLNGTISQNGKPGLVPVLGEVIQIPARQIKPSPENDTLYKPIDRTAPDFLALVQSVREHGIKEPLVLTLDYFILSGHRRHAAALCAKLQEAPCRFENVRRSAPEFISLLREYNRQRIKTHSEQLREAVLDADPEEAYQALLEHRSEAARLDTETVPDHRRQGAVSSGY